MMATQNVEAPPEAKTPEDAEAPTVTTRVKDGKVQIIADGVLVGSLRRLGNGTLKAALHIEEFGEVAIIGNKKPIKAKRSDIRHHSTNKLLFKVLRIEGEAKPREAA